MPIAQKFIGGVMLIGLVTTLVLPKRQTVGVINAATGFVRGTLATAMGTGKKV
jgi:hypothetical protein